MHFLFIFYNYIAMHGAKYILFTLLFSSSFVNYILIAEIGMLSRHTCYKNYCTKSVMNFIYSISVH